MNVDTLVAAVSVDGVEVYHCHGVINWRTNLYCSSDNLRIVAGRLVDFLGNVRGEATVETLTNTVKGWKSGIEAEQKRLDVPDNVPEERKKAAKKMAKKMAKKVMRALDFEDGEWIVDYLNDEASISVHKDRLVVNYDGLDYSFRVKLVPVDVR